MRLSDVLSKPSDGSIYQVEPFLGSRRISRGRHQMIQIGNVARNYYCLACNDFRTFVSNGRLSCLIAGDDIVSVDAWLKCITCDSSFEAWFLITSEDSLFSAAPRVRLERTTEQLRGLAKRFQTGNEDIDDLLGNAQLAFEQQLGAGAIVYLRKIMETITVRVAREFGIPTTRTNGRRKTFRDLLTEVDRNHQIIPREFSANGYRLFSELSSVIHGDGDEVVALRMYPHCQRLVVGIIDNVRTSRELKHASESLGWHQDQSVVAYETVVTI